MVSIPAQRSIPVLADAVDDGVLEHWRLLKNSASALDAIRALKLLLMNYLFERRYFGPADAVLFAPIRCLGSSAECRGRTPTFSIANGVDTDYFAPDTGQSSADAVVFEGNIGFGPNADGVRHFVRDILPLIHKRRPDVQFWIVGKDPPADVVSMSSELIHVTGYVDDVRPFVRDAAVFVCPLRMGAGIKNKLLQAWSMGKAVVATPASVGGLSALNGENVLIGDSDEAFADGPYLACGPGAATQLGRSDPSDDRGGILLAVTALHSRGSFRLASGPRS